MSRPSDLLVYCNSSGLLPPQDQARPGTILRTIDHALAWTSGWTRIDVVGSWHALSFGALWIIVIYGNMIASIVRTSCWAAAIISILAPWSTQAEHVTSLTGYFGHFCASFAPSGNVKCWGSGGYGRVRVYIYKDRLSVT